jgi:polar amino acid transport system permease protein
MKELFIDMLGKPMGIVMFQLLDATQFTIYLSLIAFVGGGLIGVVITLARISGRKGWARFATSYIWCF